MLPTFIFGRLIIQLRSICMRNIAMVPGILALLLTGVLFYVVYHRPQPVPDVVSVDHSSKQPAGNNLRMAYFNLDSLEAHYQYFKDVVDQVKGKENEMNAELSSLEKSYQKKI